MTRLSTGVAILSLSRSDFADRLHLAMARASDGAVANAPSDRENIELHLFGTNDVIFDEAVERIFIDSKTFYGEVDVSIHPKRPGWFFVRVSAHAPGPLRKSRNDDEIAPFHVLRPL